MLSQNEIKFSTKCLPEVVIQGKSANSELVNPTSKLILMGVREKEKINPNWVTGFLDGEGSFIIAIYPGTGPTSKNNKKSPNLIYYNSLLVLYKNMKSTNNLNSGRFYFGIGGLFI